MTLIHMPVILYLSRYAIQALNDFRKHAKQGRTRCSTLRILTFPIR